MNSVNNTTAYEFLSPETQAVLGRMYPDGRVETLDNGSVIETNATWQEFLTKAAGLQPVDAAYGDRPMIQQMETAFNGKAKPFTPAADSKKTKTRKAKDAASTTEPVSVDGETYAEYYEYENPEATLPSPFNPRSKKNADVEKLAQEIVQDGGVKQSVLGVYNERNRVVIIDGNRRREACILNKKSFPNKPQVYTLPVRLESTKQYTDAEILELATSLNESGKRLTTMERVKAFTQLIEMGRKQSEVAKRFGINKGLLSMLLRFTSLPTNVQKWLDSGLVTQQIGMLLVKLMPKDGEPDTDLQAAIKAIGKFLMDAPEGSTVPLSVVEEAVINKRAADKQKADKEAAAAAAEAETESESGDESEDEDPGDTNEPSSIKWRGNDILTHLDELATPANADPRIKKVAEILLQLYQGGIFPRMSRDGETVLRTVEQIALDRMIKKLDEVSKLL